METKADATHADLSADAKEKPPTEALPVGAVPKLDNELKPVVTDESAAGGNKGVEQGFCGVRCEGGYLPVAGGKNSASGVWYWDDESNVRSDIEGATHEYVNIKVPRGNQSGFLSPTVPIKLLDGSTTVQRKQKSKRSHGEQTSTRAQIEDDEGEETGRFQKLRTISSDRNEGKEVTTTHQHPPAIQEQVVAALQNVFGQRPGDVMIQKLEVHIHVDNKN